MNRTQILASALATVTMAGAGTWQRCPEPPPAPAPPNVRSLGLDVARRWYQPATLKAIVDVLARNHYNQLHLHLTDDQAYRLESTVIPACVAPQHYTKADLRTLVAYASSKGITIVPEIDTPGHMAAALACRPDLSLTTAFGTGSLDLRNAAAVGFAQALIAEWLPVFPGRDWHLGGDEWMAYNDTVNYYGDSVKARDSEYTYYNTMGNWLISNGRQPRIWNDQIVAGTHVKPNKTLTIDSWYGPTDPTATSLAAQGYRQINSNWNLLYASTDSDRYPDPAKLATLALGQFASGTVTTGIVGVQLSVWSMPGDTHTDQHIIDRLTPLLQTLAQHLWGG
ncbi:family 20 glycosylhydrolase [Kitasatospora sp. NPDC085879]|uniref:family 20 glycosylhydrolase n=1 Tax=Kitasatospora sp. NPDC085879 TaxID=3154769 RepID=UPI0034171DBC